jgi:hypothetical protein
MVQRAILEEMRNTTKRKVFPVTPENIVVHTLPGMAIKPELNNIRQLVLDLTRGNEVYNVYLGLVGLSGRASEIHLRNTPDYHEANRVYDTASVLLESGDYELHLFPPDIAGLAQRAR